MLFLAAGQRVVQTGPIPAGRSGQAERQTLLYLPASRYLDLHSGHADKHAAGKRLWEVAKLAFAPPPFFLPVLEPEHRAGRAYHLFTQAIERPDTHDPGRVPCLGMPC